MSNKEEFYENNTDDPSSAGSSSDKESIPDSDQEITKDLKSDTCEPASGSEESSGTDAVEHSESSSSKESETPSEKAKNKFNIFKVIRILCIIGFFVFTGLFINEVFIQPYRMNKVVEQTRDLYSKPTTAPVTAAPTQAPSVTTTPADDKASPTPDPTRDEQGRLLTFKELLKSNEDTKGWITIPGTNIDYVVMQNSADPQYYLTHDFNKEKQKAGCLFLDVHSSVENNTKNLVIHGHNMKSTDNMFHYLEHFKKLDYFKEHTTFTFDTIYQTGQWKIFSVFLTNGSSKKETFFDYTQATFQDDSEFMNFIYQLRIRSLFNIDNVDINEDDQIVSLSTCSYEINDYRLVIVARKVRPGEDPTVDADSITKNKTTLYPDTYYKNYGGEAPELPATFEEALEKGTIKWYTPVENEKK